MCLDLGGAGAVQTDGWERRVLMAGSEAKTMKRHINAVWAALPPSSLDRERLLTYGEPGTSKYREQRRVTTAAVAFDHRPIRTGSALIPRRKFE